MEVTVGGSEAVDRARNALLDGRDLEGCGWALLAMAFSARHIAVNTSDIAEALVDDK